MSVKKNYLYNLCNQVLVMLIPLITIPYISRVLGPEGVGKNTFTYTYVQYFIMIGNLGLNTYAKRQIAYVRDDKNKLRKTFSQLTMLKSIILGFSLLLYITIFLIINKQDRLIYALQGLYILAAVADISWLFMGLENFKTIVTRSIFTKLIGTALLFLLVKQSDQVWLYILILSSTQLLSQVFLWINLPEALSFKEVKKTDLWIHLRSSFKLFIPELAAQVYLLFDKTVLGWFKGNAQVGIYDNSQKIILMSLNIITSLTTVMLPFMSNAYANGDMDSFKRSTKKSFAFASLFSIPIAFGIVAIANNMVPWFFGEKFLHIKTLLYIETWMIIPIAWSSILGYQVMVPMGKEHYYSISVIASAIVDFSINIIFIPKYGYDAAAFSTVVAETTGTIIQLYYLRNFINLRDLFKGVYKNITGAAVMFVLIKLIDRFLNPNILSTLLEVIAGVITYIIILLLLKDETMKTVLKKIKH